MVLVRKGTEQDLTDLLTLIKELALFEKAPAEVEVTIEEMTTSFLVNKAFEYFVLTVNDVVKGIALYYYKYSTWKGPCLFLEDLIVTEADRGKGYGHLLFEKVVEIAKKEKVRRMEWQVLEWNAAAIHFYKKYAASFDAEWINCKLTANQLS